MSKHTNEAIALAAGLLGQCKGDVPSARRAAGEAHEWLCSIDLEYKPPVAAPAAVAVDAGKLAEAQRRLELALEAKDAMRCEHENAIAAWQKQVKALEDKLERASKRVEEPAEQVVQVQMPVVSNAPAPAAADPFAHLPPAMREYARQAAAARSSIEID